MNKLFYYILSIAMVCSICTTVQAGNPDRQGEAGAYELLMNPWARSAGLHTMNTSSISGVEAMRLNVAGLPRINKTEIVLGYADYLDGTDISMNAFGLAQKMGKGAFGLSIMVLDFGDIIETTTELPEGTGGTFSPSFFNMGLSYAHIFENKVSVGLTMRVVSESFTSDLSAFGFALDAGVQYVAGPKDNFKFGISLRNVGSTMTFSGEGLASQGPAPDGDSYEITFNQRAEDFELPSLLNIGGSYDFYASEKHRISVLANFTANSFSRDQIGAGVEYSLNDLFMVRGGYKVDVDSGEEFEDPIYDGLSAGASVMVPLSKENKNLRFGIDYAYRNTRLWNGTHNISVRFAF